MYSKTTKHFIFLTASLLAFSSCKKDHTVIPGKELATDKKINYIPSADLIWTNQTYPWFNTNILSPFAGGTSREFPTEYMSDMKPADGWELYMNTFAVNPVDTQKKYFVIYNRYRGLLRIYYYLDNTNFSPTKNIVWELGLNGTANNSKVLNFEQGELVDNSIKLLYTTRVQLEKKVQPNGCWYAEQFELAYDESIYPQSYAANVLKIGLMGQDVTKYSFTGSQTGTIDGTIQVPQKTGSSLWSTLVNGAMNLGMGAISSGASAALKSIFKDGLSALKMSQITEGALESIKSSSVIKDLPKSIFNAILGKNDTGTTYSTEKVNLKINTSIKLEGTGTGSPTGLGTFDVLFSGTQNLTAPESGIIPIYTKKLGVFNIVGTPIIKKWMYKYDGEVDSQTTAEFALDYNSFSMIWNPDLINQTPDGASIQNLRKQFVLIDVKSPVKGTGYVGEYITPQTETLVAMTGDGTASFTRTFKTSQAPSWGPSVGAYAVRISFDVVPNNGSTKTTIIKTILATSADVDPE
ncbi:hypothetical protein HDF26_004007 [Pedobacter cryoconitis]|uniref:Uncharacterized protein n=1 Tax=Pedobacter cryoconitis TaxID=188932 RepID=A0A7W8ZKR1_9SPHI|nr:hypothetical protein [Pedobacter cryoconitis]MBB5635578.1 hypothetical protein [Pedobacter cryoconitis]MBB6273547.1 hypothetical protein [Pedobacter cryoconitis]